ncbi:MAG: hypothetical protein ACLFVQ_10065 [Chitinispirillaceae bacterium]
MYEKPQYLTQTGFKRLPRNPFSGSVQECRKETSADSQKNCNSTKKTKNVFPSTLSEFIIEQRKARISQPARKQISDKAAELIAMALKDMLRS